MISSSRPAALVAAWLVFSAALPAASIRAADLIDLHYFRLEVVAA